MFHFVKKCIAKIIAAGEIHVYLNRLQYPLISVFGISTPSTFNDSFVYSRQQMSKQKTKHLLTKR